MWAIGKTIRRHKQLEFDLLSLLFCQCISEYANFRPSLIEMFACSVSSQQFRLVLCQTKWQKLAVYGQCAKYRLLFIITQTIIIIISMAFKYMYRSACRIRSQHFLSVWQQPKCFKFFFAIFRSNRFSTSERLHGKTHRLIRFSCSSCVLRLFAVWLLKVALVSRGLRMVCVPLSRSIGLFVVLRCSAIWCTSGCTNFVCRSFNEL